MMVLVYALVAIIGAPRWLWVVVIVGAGRGFVDSCRSISRYGGSVGARRAQQRERAVLGYAYGPLQMIVEQINNTTGTTRYLHHDQ
jgi:hypothetical protein